MGLFKKRLKGVKVKHEKNTMNQEVEVMPTPEMVYISMVQHIGAPCKPLVKKDDHVKIGQPIGDTEAYVSAPIHSSVSGTVVKIENIMSSLGTKDQTIVIRSDETQEVWEGVKPPEVSNRSEFLEAVKQSGLVGFGGAAFPLHVKYNPKNIDQVKTLIVNGAECEPYITSDYRNMIEKSHHIMNGIKMTMDQLGLEKAYIGIENNKPLAIEKLSELAKSHGNIEVIPLRALYPQGAERVLIYEVTGKPLPEGKLPADIGILVSNISTIAALSEYMETGMPVISKTVTVDGSAITERKNLKVLIGARIRDIVEYCGGYSQTPKKILMGGPMMGRTIYDDSKAIIKNNNAIIVLGEDKTLLPKETPCIKCGRCVRVCPLKLLPTTIAEAYEHNDIEELDHLAVTICMECGCCSYVCPAKKQLALINRLSKKLVIERRQA